MGGARLAALAWAARRPRKSARTTVKQGALTPAAGLIALAALATLASVNFAIRQKESLIASGAKVYVALAPVDPRSLMQGDFMRLNYALPALGRDESRRDWSQRRSVVVARRDASGVAQLLRIVSAESQLEPGEMRIELTPKDGGLTLVSDAWFFREGDGKRWEAAKFAEFRVLPDGRALLVGLADAKLQTIAVRP